MTNDERKQKEPHLLNLNEDQLLTGVVFHFLVKSVVTVGRKDAKAPPDICLNGLRFITFSRCSHSEYWQTLVTIQFFLQTLVTIFLLYTVVIRRATSLSCYHHRLPGHLSICYGERLQQWKVFFSSLLFTIIYSSRLISHGGLYSFSDKWLK